MTNGQQVGAESVDGHTPHTPYPGIPKQAEEEWLFLKFELQVIYLCKFSDEILAWTVCGDRHQLIPTAFGHRKKLTTFRDKMRAQTRQGIHHYWCPLRSVSPVILCHAKSIANIRALTNHRGNSSHCLQVPESLNSHS
ncbi:hypothetical protein VTN77DRAFT_4417 [Rasamsonia byssochlamydoides]|uniref:uncharacterized protein n=1 Tax=Rasamsonia byssochlamydoides TaxID=89139 RepID=UPI0037422448